MTPIARYYFGGQFFPSSYFNPTFFDTPAKENSVGMMPYAQHIAAVATSVVFAFNMTRNVNWHKVTPHVMQFIDGKQL